MSETLLDLLEDLTVVQSDKLPVADLGTIAIRVFVLPAKPKKGGEKEQPKLLDAEDGEQFLFDEKGSTPVSSYLESSRGKRCVVYVVNGQRQEAEDSSFIVQDLGFRYLRSRMIIMIDVDGLAPEAIGRLMQGSRQNFYQGAVREAVRKRVIACLKDDPDLIRLEEEAEEAVSELSAGDEKVKQTLDQLIDAHHNHGHDFAEGAGEHGDSQQGDGLGFKKVERAGVVTLLPPSTGAASEYPVLASQPASTIRLHPNESATIKITSIPSGHWAALAHLYVESDPRYLELNAQREVHEDHGIVTLKFNEPDGYDSDQYPIRSRVKVTARFNGLPDARQIELPILVQPQVPRPDPLLTDEPTKLKVSSRSPIRLTMGGVDTHVRLRWDGKDELLSGSNSRWSLKATLVGNEARQPELNFSRPRAGRFTLLISPDSSWEPGKRLKFEVIATGPSGRKLLAIFDADVVDAPVPPEPTQKQPRLVEREVPTGTVRRPPYQLKIIKREQYNQDCWNRSEWTDDDAGAFIKPTDRTPLTLIINEDMIALKDFRQALTKRNTEANVLLKLNKYTTHIAFHLYQMYQATVGKKDENIDIADGLRSEEVRRVALTMIKLMDVAEK